MLAYQCNVETAGYTQSISRRSSSAHVIHSFHAPLMAPMNVVRAIGVVYYLHIAVVYKRRKWTYFEKIGSLHGRNDRGVKPATKATGAIEMRSRRDHVYCLGHISSRHSWARFSVQIVGSVTHTLLKISAIH